MNKKNARLRRAKRSRLTIKRLGVVRLCVNRTPHHIYAQIINDESGETLAFASSLEKGTSLKHGSNCEAASSVGELIAKKAIAKEIKQVVFDRGGFLYHGRIKALAEAAREHGLDF